MLVRCLGEQLFDRLPYDGREEMHHRHFFHLRCHGTPPERWRHREPDPSDGGEPPLFALIWAALPNGVPALNAAHGAFLPELFAGLKLVRRSHA